MGWADDGQGGVPGARMESEKFTDHRSDSKLISPTLYICILLCKPKGLAVCFRGQGINCFFLKEET